MVRPGVGYRARGAATGPVQPIVAGCDGAGAIAKLAAPDQTVIRKATMAASPEASAGREMRGGGIRGRRNGAGGHDAGAPEQAIAAQNAGIGAACIVLMQAEPAEGSSPRSTCDDAA